MTGTGIRRHDGEHNVVELVLDRPEKLNAVGPAMADSLQDHLDQLASSEARAVMLRAEGRAFCAGRDLRADWASEEPEELLERVFNPLVAGVAKLPMPTLAAVQGHCLGVGLGLALACDIVVVAADAQLGSPFGKRGTLLDSGGHALLLQRLGRSRTLELIYTSRLLDGGEAEALGLANLCVHVDELTVQARRLASEIGAGPTLAFKQSKRIIGELDEDRRLLDVSLRSEAVAQGWIFRSDDFREAMAARAESRPPVFRGA